MVQPNLIERFAVPDQPVVNVTDVHGSRSAELISPAISSADSFDHSRRRIPLSYMSTHHGDLKRTLRAKS